MSLCGPKVTIVTNHHQVAMFFVTPGFQRDDRHSADHLHYTLYLYLRIILLYYDQRWTNAANGKTGIPRGALAPSGSTTIRAAKSGPH